MITRLEGEEEAEGDVEGEGEGEGMYRIGVTQDSVPGVLVPLHNRKG